MRKIRGRLVSEAFCHIRDLATGKRRTATVVDEHAAGPAWCNRRPATHSPELAALERSQDPLMAGILKRNLDVPPHVVAIPFDR